MTESRSSEEFGLCQTSFSPKRGFRNYPDRLRWISEVVCVCLWETLDVLVGGSPITAYNRLWAKRRLATLT